MISKQTLDSINYDTNCKLVYSRDSDRGFRDEWAHGKDVLDRGTGDCEDYCTAKAWRLVHEQGCDVNDLRIAIVDSVINPGKSRHAVLLAKSQRKKGWFRKRVVDCEYVLDNMYDGMYTLEETRYRVLGYRSVLRYVS